MSTLIACLFALIGLLGIIVCQGAYRIVRLENTLTDLTVLLVSENIINQDQGERLIRQLDK